MKLKRSFALFMAGLLIVCGLVAAYAAEAGSPGDPLLALNWIKNSFIPNTTVQAQAKVDARYAEIASKNAMGEELLLKRGDVLRLETGSTLIPLAGNLSISAAGSVIDVTEGDELPTDRASAMSNHTYLTAENTTAAFSVTSDTAVLRLSGVYQLSPSVEVDYNALAHALREMSLLQGTTTPYGFGYDLELAPTRIEGLVMFLRLLGEEEAALAFSGASVSFADVPNWALPYVAYAYDKGYTKGQGKDAQGRVVFGSEGALTGRDYTTFLLRALDYKEGSDFQWSSSIPDALSLGVLTEGEKALLEEKPFHRAQVIYLSYFALSAQVAGEGGSLLDQLIASKTIDLSVAEAAMEGLASQRI